MAIIKNNEKRLIVLTDNFETHRLLPGANVIDNDVWARLRKAHADRVGPSKSLTEIGAETKKNGAREETTFKSLTELSVQEATEVIEKTFNLDTLNEWKRQVSREDLRREIMNRIELVESAGTK